MDLRQRAEEALGHAEMSVGQVDASLRRNLSSLIEELRIYQAELEIQNDELVWAQAESERYRQHYQRLFALLPLPGLIVDHQGVIREFNRQAEHVLGVRPPHLASPRSLYRFLHDRDETNLAKLLARSEFDDVPGSARVHLSVPDGEPTAYEVFVHALPSNANQGERLFLVLLADQSAVEALADREQRLGNILWATNVGTWEWNVQTGELRVNERYAEMLGYRLDELQPVRLETWDRLTHPVDLETSRAALERHLRGEAEFYEFELRMRHRSGAWIWMLDWGRVASRTPDGRPLWMVGTHLDISKRKQMEAKLADASEELREAQRVARLGTWSLDHPNQALRWSELMFEIFETPNRGGEVSEAGFLAIVHPEDREKRRAALQRSLSSPDLAQCTYRLLFSDGRVKHVLEQFETEMDGAGRPLRSLGTVQDVTRQQSIQRALAALAHELAPLQGEAFYRAVCEYLITALGLDIAFVGQFDSDQSRVQVVSGWTREGALEPFVYDLRGTPCAMALDQDSVLYPRDVQHLFREDALLAELGIESYMGATLVDKQGWSMGILVCVGRRAMEPGELVQAEQLRDLFVDRVSAEMLRSDAEARLQQKSEEVEQYFNYALDLLSISDTAGRFTKVNPAWEKTLGYPAGAIEGQSYLDMVHPDDLDATMSALSELRSGRSVTSFVNRYRHRDGSYRWIEWYSRPDQGVVFAVARDVSERVEYQQKLEYIAMNDVLTQLPNRILVSDRLRQGMAQAQRRGTMLAVAFLDLDGFKAINDRHGHDRGDEFLVAIANGMRAALRTVDTLGRFGGDEFAAVIPDLSDRAAVKTILERLLLAAQQPVSIDGQQTRVSASIGVTFFPQSHPDVDADQLLRQADEAMYRAKRSGKNRYQIYDAQDAGT